MTDIEPREQGETPIILDRYPVEDLREFDDDGTMRVALATLSAAVVGRRIVSAQRATRKPRDKAQWWSAGEGFLITLDNGKQVWLHDTHDCCAYTTLSRFLLNPELVDHAITGIGTTGGYTTWHIYADLGDVLTLEVEWSCGNPFYYGYGFDIVVEEIKGETITIHEKPQALAIEGDSA